MRTRSEKTIGFYQNSINILVKWPHFCYAHPVKIKFNVYVQDLSHLGVYYIIYDTDFSPQVDARVFQNGAGFTSLMYDGTTTQQIETQFTSNFGSSAPIDGGTGYTVEQFSLNGATFTTTDYQV